MTRMYFTIEKLTARVAEIATAATRATLQLDHVYAYSAPGPATASAMAPPPTADDPGWRLLRPGEPWGLAPGDKPGAPPRMLREGIPASGGDTHWLRAAFSIPGDWHGQPVLLGLDWQGRGQSSLEAILYLDRQTLAGVDEFHRAVLLPAETHDGTHEALLRCYVPFEQPFGGLKLCLRDDAIFRLGLTMRALLEAAQTFRDSDPERHALLTQLDAAYNTLDLRKGWQSERFAESARVALEMLSAVSESPTPNPQPPTPALVATGHAHLDIAWLWPLWRTRQKVAHTVATALHLMERYPEYHFSMSQPQVYTYLQHDDPELYARLKQRAAEGRFEPVGMMWLEADCNISGGESLVRHLLHGARFFAEEFGELNHVVWLPDVFGYSAALPQLLRLAGISCFMTTKISWNQFNRMPCDTFRWRGIDGSEVLTHFVTVTDRPMTHWAEPQFYTYNAHMTGGEVFGTWNHYRQQAINKELLYIYGYGDGGGGPTEEMLEAARVFADLPGFPRVRPGRVDQFFQQLYERVWNDPGLPTWSGELYLEYHRGTYTSQARTKRNNRAAELRYREAEWLNAWAVAQGGYDRQSELDEGWKLIMLNQFHDVLPGSSVPLVYVESNEQYAQVQRIACEVERGAIEQILTNDQRPTTKDQATAASVLPPSSLVVFNSLPWDRIECVRIELADDDEPPTLADAEGHAVATQVVEEPGGARALLAEVGVPSYGYTILTNDQRHGETGRQGGGETPDSSNASSRITHHPSPITHHPSLVARRSSLENGELRLELDDDGEIASLVDLRRRRELIGPGASGNQLVAYEDRPLNWEAWDIDIFYEDKPYPVREILDWRVAEEGPLRAAIEIVRRLGQSTIRQRIALWRDSRRIDFITEVDWHERQTLLRTLFPLDINAARATCEIQFGAAERPTHRNTSWDWARFEVCAHRWVDLSEGDYGVALLNDGKYGHSLHHNTLGISLLKSAIHPDPEADRGQHRFTYSLLPHEGDWRAGQVVRRAYELNAPLRAVERSKVEMFERSTKSFLSTPTDHIVVETVKVTQDGNGLIVRLYEAHNQRGPASLRFDRAVAGAVETDLLEREIGPLEVDGNEVRFDVRPFEIKTLRVRLSE
jgi:alpha-mannosidase